MPLLATDRCDRCGAQAYTRWRELIGDEPIGRDLLLCAHHTHEHEPAMADRFALVDDDRDKLDQLTATPEP